MQKAVIKEFSCRSTKGYNLDGELLVSPDGKFEGLGYDPESFRYTLVTGHFYSEEGEKKIHLVGETKLPDVYDFYDATYSDKKHRLIGTHSYLDEEDECVLQVTGVKCGKEIEEAKVQELVFLIDEYEREQLDAANTELSTNSNMKPKTRSRKLDFNYFDEEE